jgi:hypothetical protein
VIRVSLIRFGVRGDNVNSFPITLIGYRQKQPDKQPEPTTFAVVIGSLFCADLTIHP